MIAHRIVCGTGEGTGTPSSFMATMRVHHARPGVRRRVGTGTPSSFMATMRVALASISSGGSALAGYCLASKPRIFSGRSGVTSVTPEQ